MGEKIPVEPDHRIEQVSDLVQGRPCDPISLAVDRNSQRRGNLGSVLLQ